MQSEVIEKLGYADTQPNPKFEVMAAFVKEQASGLYDDSGIGMCPKWQYGLGSPYAHSITGHDLPRVPGTKHVPAPTTEHCERQPISGIPIPQLLVESEATRVVPADFRLSQLLHGQVQWRGRRVMFPPAKCCLVGSICL
eukprot:1303924-Rhodomonas_salina.1